MVEAMAKRAKTDPKAKEMSRDIRLWLDGLNRPQLAIAYLMLVLHQMGLGSLWMAGPMHAKADIEKILKIPAGMDVVTLVPVGYPAENPTKDRKPVSEVAR